MAGFIKLSRQLLDHDIWLGEPFSRGQAWVDMLFLASWKDSYFRIRGNRIDVRRGQLAYSVKTLSERWGWSRGKVSRFLDELQNDQQIEQQKTKLTTLITIKNYEKYQSKRATERATDLATDGQQTDTLEEVKRSKEKKKGQFAPAVPSLWDLGESIGLTRSLIGKQIKQAGEEKVAEVIAQMAIKKPADPKQYFVGATKVAKYGSDGI